MSTTQSEIYDFEEYREEESFADGTASGDIVHVVTEDDDVVEIRGTVLEKDGRRESIVP